MLVQKKEDTPLLTAQRFRLEWIGARRISEHIALQFNIVSLFSIQRQGILLNFAYGQFTLYAETGQLWNFN